MMALRPQHVAPELLNKVTKALGITALDQWYYVSQHAVTKAIGARVLNNFGGIVGFLKSAYPGHRFDEEKLTSKKNLEKDQKFIEVIIRKLFPNTEIHTKARKAVGILNPETDAYLEIDFWIPSLKLGIEYQDKHHYGYQWYANGALEDYQKRDDLKKATMPTMGYTLITIGYWWDKTLESVIATIRKYRPDLLQEYDDISTEPIPLDPPPGFVSESPVIPGVAGIMSPFVPGYNFDPTDWYAGEKHDGIRGVYNPKLNKMFSRTGKELSIFPSLLRDVPDMLVEGEIITGRGNYNNTAGVSNHTHHDKVNWSMFRYVLYDIPDATLGNYTQRYSIITSELSTRPFIFAQTTSRVLVTSKPHLKALVDAIISDAGEGVIVQKDAQYEYGRAKGLAKIKVRRDADAQVLSINKSSCTCKLVSGVIAKINFSDGFNPSKLETGDIVSYFYTGYSKDGQPKRGEIYKVRYDICWESLISDCAKKLGKKSLKDAIGTRSLLAKNTLKNKMGHWNKSSNALKFFDGFARKAGFDPLVAENWYAVRIRAIQQAGGAGLLKAYDFDLHRALSAAYPKLKFEEEKFVTTHYKIKENKMEYGFWTKPPNVRAFFDDFARTAGFDPLVAENWYSVRSIALQNAGGGGPLSAYGFNVKVALSSAYPELKFEENFRTSDKIRTRKIARGHWRNPLHVREFFDKFAGTSGFDPLVADRWYKVKINTLRNTGGDGLLKAFKFKLKNALSRAYPELKFDEKFRVQDKKKT